MRDVVVMVSSWRCVAVKPGDAEQWQWPRPRLHCSVGDQRQQCPAPESLQSLSSGHTSAALWQILILFIVSVNNINNSLQEYVCKAWKNFTVSDMTMWWSDDVGHIHPQLGGDHRGAVVSGGLLRWLLLGRWRVEVAGKTSTFKTRIFVFLYNKW